MSSHLNPAQLAVSRAQDLCTVSCLPSGESNRRSPLCRHQSHARDRVAIPEQSVTYAQGARSMERGVRMVQVATGKGWPRVSIVIPALNEARNLPHVFARLPADVHEVILVDGHSSTTRSAVARRLRPACGSSGR